MRIHVCVLIIFIPTVLLTSSRPIPTFVSNPPSPICPAHILVSAGSSSPGTHSLELYYWYSWLNKPHLPENALLGYE